MIRRIAVCALLLSAATLQATVLPVDAGVNPESSTPTVLTATMTGAAERPGPGDPDAFGRATIIIRDNINQVCVVAWWARVDGTLSGFHIHLAPSTTSGPVVIGFTTPRTGSSWTYQCRTVENEALIDNLIANPQQYYINLHSQPLYAPGAIRGQLASF